MFSALEEQSGGFLMQENYYNHFFSLKARGSSTLTFKFPKSKRRGRLSGNFGGTLEVSGSGLLAPVPEDCKKLQVRASAAKELTAYQGVEVFVTSIRGHNRALA